jgi:hypothetical protein
MEEGQKWGGSRYLAIAIVAVLHVSVLIALITAAKTRILSTPGALELLLLPRNAVPEVPSSPSAIAGRSKKAPPAATPSSSAITIDPPAAGDTAGVPIDWGQEIRNVAAGMAKRGSAELPEEPASSPPSPFAAPSPHHKGEQIPTSDGRWIVFVSDNCFQVSKSITAITNATNNGMSLQTYCTSRSKTPRGDLFEQLPAYKKLHPDN